jgi:hypothetical protein
MPHKLKYTDEQLLDKARQFYKKNNRVPGMNDFPGGLSRTIIKRIGDWTTYLNRAIGKNPAYKFWQKDDLIKFAREFWHNNKRFPINNEIAFEGRNIRNIILNRFSSVNEWLEESIGTSPRIEILRAIDELTPPGCDEATPREILAYIRKRMMFPTNLLGFNSANLSESGYITGGRLDRTSWWKLTPKGREFLKGFQNV